MSLLPSEPTKVSGSDCLSYIDRAIGIASHLSTNEGSSRSDALDVYTSYSQPLADYGEYVKFYTATSVVYVDNLRNSINNYGYARLYYNVKGWKHNASIRKIGLVTKHYDDGGLEVALLSDGDVISMNSRNTNIDRISQIMGYGATKKYNLDMSGLVRELDGAFPNFPDVVAQSMPVNINDTSRLMSLVKDSQSGDFATFDELYGVGYSPYLNVDWYTYARTLGYPFTQYLGVDTTSNEYTLTKDKTTTLWLGVGYDYDGLSIDYPEPLRNNPLIGLSGDLYSFGTELSGRCGIAYAPIKIPVTDFTTAYYYADFNGGRIESFNLTTIPYNLILTENEQGALNYLENGTLPTDAWLYPLDWDNFPSYSSDDSDEPEGDDTPEDVPSGDDTPDMEDTPTETPSANGLTLSNNNYYWITLPQIESFTNWFWNDVGDWSDWDDVVGKIEGLYNDLSSAVLNLRYMPIDISWVGGTDGTSNIVVGMVEDGKTGLVDKISKRPRDIQSTRSIGTITISKHFNTFLDFSPYTNLALYLPYHGFMDIDVNYFMGNRLDVECAYDILTGTIQYFVFCKALKGTGGRSLAYTATAKMSADIPLTLQTKSDRDNAVISNVAQTATGLGGAIASVATGSPIGAIMGANTALRGGTQSAPLSVRGTVDGWGSFYTPSRCFITEKLPVVHKAGNYNRVAGYQDNTYRKLSGLSGYTKCYTPRVTWSNTTPLQEEIETIYSLMEGGIIL